MDLAAATLLMFPGAIPDAFVRPGQASAARPGLPS